MAALRHTLLPALGFALITGSAAAAVRVDFEGLTQSVGGVREDAAISDFYAGGSSKVPGTSTPVTTGSSAQNLGVRFDAGALVTETASGGNGGQSSVFGLTRELLLENGTLVSNSNALGRGAAYSLNSDSITVSVGSGFNDGLSFFFNALSDLTVSLLRLDGSVLVSEDFTFSSTVLCPIAQTSCQWNAASIPLTTTAFGVRFTGAAGAFAIDNLTLGSLDPFGALPGSGNGGTGGNNGGNNGGSGGNGGTGEIPGTGGGGVVSPIPEPSTYALMALGLGLVGWMARRRQRAAA